VQGTGTPRHLHGLRPMLSSSGQLPNRISGYPHDFLKRHFFTSLWKAGVSACAVGLVIPSRGKLASASKKTNPAATARQIHRYGGASLNAERTRSFWDGMMPNKRDRTSARALSSPRANDTRAKRAIPRGRLADPCSLENAVGCLYATSTTEVTAAMSNPEAMLSITDGSPAEGIGR